MLNRKIDWFCFSYNRRDIVTFWHSLIQYLTQEWIIIPYHKNSSDSIPRKYQEIITISQTHLRVCQSICDSFKLPKEITDGLHRCSINRKVAIRINRRDCAVLLSYRRFYVLLFLQTGGQYKFLVTYIRFNLRFYPIYGIMKCALSR